MPADAHQPAADSVDGPAARQRIYLDNAATSWPKPEAVYAAVENYQRTLGVAAGRSAYQSADAVARLVDQARASVARLINSADPSRVTFAFNGTDALNIAIHGTLSRADHVVTTVIEHNSVLRPLSELRRRCQIEVSYVDCDETGRIAPRDIASALRPNTRLIAISHASNVTGAIQPIDEIATMVAEHPALLLVDAAQSLGHVRVQVDAGIDLLASSGHKGLLGPLGTGVLYVGPHAANSFNSFRQGGTGTASEDDRQPEVLPEKLESGNLNVAGIVGLLAGVNTIQQQGLETLRRHEVELTDYLMSKLAAFESVTIWGPPSARDRVGVVSFTIDGHDPHEVSALLDTIAGIETRSGLHCAPRMHKRLGTAETQGTVRASLGPLNTAKDIDTLVNTLRMI